MEASTVQSKKAINKGKLKKTIKNVLCRPDPLFWPLISEEQKQLFEKSVNKYVVEMPYFEKLHWNELKLIPKEKRPKPPKLKRVDGLLFGISECCNAVKSNQCAAVLIEASVNPQLIVQPILEACIETRIPVICVSDLRKISSRNFHIPTSCLGLKSGYLTDLQSVVLEIAKSHELPQNKMPKNVETSEVISPKPHDDCIENETTLFPYLYRSDKKSRVFVPSEHKGQLLSDLQQFKGQDFIEFKGKPSGLKERDSYSYKKMIVKRISNNPNRAKSKKTDIKKLV